MSTGNHKAIKHDFITAEGVFTRNEDIAKETVPSAEVGGADDLRGHRELDHRGGALGQASSSQTDYYLGRFFARMFVPGAPSLKSQSVQNYFKTTLGEQKET